MVTGATGLVGGWLVRRLLAAGADVVCLVRDWVPQSELVRSRLLEPSQGGPRRHPGSGAARTRLGRIRNQHGLPSGGADHRRHRQPQPGLHFRDQHRRHVVAAGGLPAQPGCQADRPGLLGQGLWRPGAAPLRRDDAAAGPAPLRCQQVVRRPDRASLCDDLWAAGGDHPLRQFLRRRRPQLESHRPRHDPRRFCAASGR